MPPHRDTPRALVGWGVAYLVCAVVGLYALWLTRQTLLLLYVSGLLAVGVSPVVRFIERKSMLGIGTRVPRWLAILVVYVVFIGALVAIAFMILPPLVAQARAFAHDAPQYVQRIQHALARRGLVDQEMSVGAMVQQAPGGDIVSALLVTVWSVIGGLFGFVTILIIAFYLLVEGEQPFRAALRLLPPERRDAVRAAGEEITVKLSAWLTGQLILAGSIGASSAIFLVIAGVPYFWVLALMAAIGELIPYVGPILAAIPALVVAASISTKLAVVTAGYYLLQQQVESNLIVPKLMERQVGLSAIAVIVALLVGGALLGITGVLLAVPTAAIIRVVVQRFMTNGEAEPLPGERSRPKTASAK